MTAAPIALRAPSNAPLLVWVLAPLVETDDADIAWYADYSQSQAEYERAFAALGVQWRWQPVTMRDYEQVVQRILRESAGHEPVVFNLCDGDEVNGVEIVAKFARSVDLRDLRGTVIVVPAQNPQALQAQHRYAVGHLLRSPLDQNPAGYRTQ